MKQGFTLFILIMAALISCQTDNRTVRVASVIDVNVPESQRKVISVMKFDDRSIKTKDYAPWSMGIPEMIMESLGAIPHYKVVSRDYLLTKVIKEQEFQLLGATDQASAVKLGNLMNAQYIVVGSFQVFNDQLIINAKVISVETGQIIIQTSVKGDLDEFYKVQNDLAVRITQGMNIYLSPEAQKKLLENYEKRETKIIEASLNNYRGEQKLEELEVQKKKGDKERVKKAREEAKENFKKAVNIDQNYKKAKGNLKKVMAIPMTL